MAEQIIRFAQEPLSDELTASEGAVRSALELLNSQWQQFEAANLSMQQQIHEDETREALNDIRARTQNLYVKAKGLLYDEQSRMGSSSSRVPSVASVQIGSSIQAAGPTQSQLVYRGSKPKLPKFSGDPKEWESFRDLFRAVYHGRQDIAPVEKFVELHCALEGDAKEAIKAFDITDLDYPVAWQTLLDRFDKPDVLATKHVDALFELERLTDESAQGLQKLYDEFNLHVEAIRTLDPLDWRVHAIRRAMDPLTKRAWVEETQRNETARTYEGLKTFLKQRISTLSTLGGVQTTSTSHQTSRRHRSRDGPSARVLAVASNVKCDLCSETHSTYKCERLHSLTPEMRCQEVEKRGPLFNCLRVGYSSRSCKSTGRCQTCGRKHHIKLHLDAHVLQRMNERRKRSATETAEQQSRGVTATKNAKLSSPNDS